jgi:tryptophan 2-monooxygenase
MPAHGGTGGASHVGAVEHGDGVWRAGWPNPADLNFDFFALLKGDMDSPIAAVSQQGASKRIAVIGAGLAGATAARELVRCGFTNVHLFEATERIGGRLYSRPINEKNLSGTPTTYELGAMRVPFFPSPGSNNSLADYYVSLFDIKMQDFPNPGARGVKTAVYMNDGLGPDPRSRAVNPIIFTNEEGRPDEINDRIL